MIILYVAILFLSLIPVSSACYWAKAYGGNMDDVISALAIAPNGDIILVGNTNSTTSTGDYDIFILRLDGNGNVVWQKTYGGNHTDWADVVLVTPDESIIVIGGTYSFGFQPNNYTWIPNIWIIKLSLNGNIIWQKAYGGKDLDLANAATVTPMGDIIVVGLTWSFGGKNAWVLRLDSNGNIKWERKYSTNNKYDEFKAVTTTSNGDAIIAGITRNEDGCDVLVLKINKNGNIIWQRKYSGKFCYSPKNIAITSDGDILILGYARAWILKLDKIGNIKWRKIYGRSNQDIFYAISVLPNKDIIVVGKTSSYSIGKSDALVLKIPPDGNLVDLSRNIETTFIKTNILTSITKAKVLNSSARINDLQFLAINSSAIVTKIVEINKHQGSRLCYEDLVKIAEANSKTYESLAYFADHGLEIHYHAWQNAMDTIKESIGIEELLLESLVPETAIYFSVNSLVESTKAITESMKRAMITGYRCGKPLDPCHLEFTPELDYCNSPETAYDTEFIEYLKRNSLYGINMYESFYREYPTHLTIQLLYLSWLCEKEKESWKNKDIEAAKKWIEKRKEFIDSMLQWLQGAEDTYTMTCPNKELKNYYRNVIVKTRDYIKSDKNYIESLEKTLKITDPVECKSKEGEKKIPGFEALLFISSLILLLILRKSF